MLICEAVEPDGKTCRACKQYKTLSAYSKSPKGIAGRRSECKACEAPRIRRNNLKKNYGITPEDFDSMLGKQRGACALCGTTEAWSNNESGLYVDHDHATGAVRSLLCSPCNVGLGMFKDKPELMRRAAAYVEHHAAQS